jgi:hypothetical protein
VLEVEVAEPLPLVRTRLVIVVTEPEVQELLIVTQELL